MDIPELEKALRGLLNGQHTSLSIAFNDNSGPNYQTVGECLERLSADDWGVRGWISEEDKAKAIAENSWWSLQWYPETPVGFHVIHASSLAALLEHVLAT